MRPTLPKPKHYKGAGESTPLLLLSSIYIPGSKNVKVPTALLERQRALQEPGVGKAAHLIKDAVMGYQDAPYEGYFDPYSGDNNVIRNKMSVVAGRLVVYLRGAVIFASWVLFMLSFLEPPHWCRDASHLQIVADKQEADLNYNNNNIVKEYGDCKLLLSAEGITADGEDIQSYYPNSGSMYVSIYQSKVIEMTCVAFIALYFLLEFVDDGFETSLFFYPGHKRRKHAIQCTTLVCIISSILFDVTAYNSFFRLVILGTFLRSFQRELFTFMKMIPSMMIPLSMLAIIITFYAWFGVVIFNDSPQGLMAFPNLVEGMWTLWICVTTANYPDVMMPSYNVNRAVALFFISFMVLSFFYLMNLVLAIAMDAYDKSIEERKFSRQELVDRLLGEAFSLLDLDGDGLIPRESIMHVMTILNQDVPDIRGLSSDEMSILFAFLDKDGDEKISSADFTHFGSVLLLKLRKKSSYATFVERHFPSVFTSRSWRLVCRTVKSPRFDQSIELILVLNAVVIAIQDYDVLAGLTQTRDRECFEVWEGVETVFTVVYCVEALLKIGVYGWRVYINQPKNVFDFIITVLVVVASAYVYYPNAYSDHSLVQFVVMVRVLRLSRLLFSIEQFRLFGAISVEIVPAAASVFTVLLFIAYFFASIGMLLFGGAITRDPTNPHSQLLLEAEGFVNNEYWANNFNDMTSGMIVLFNWLVRSWTEEASALEFASGDKWLVRLFFFSFYLLGVIGISNVITSFVINAFFQQLATIEQRQSKVEEKIEGEATIRGSHAIFHSAEITGTGTGLGGSVYFAKIHPRHSDVELDEREALKALFSRSTSSTADDQQK